MSATSGAAAPQPRVRWGVYPSLVAAVVLVLSYVLMPQYAETADAVGYMLRVTARVAFLFLILAYIARPLVVMFGTGQVLVANRRYLGLAMALAHTVHFIFVVISVRSSGESLELLTLLFGGLAFLLMWGMAITSNDAAVRLLGRKWKLLHIVGLHYLWLIFMQSFAGLAAFDDPYFLYAALSAVGLAALLLRIAAWRRQRVRRAV